MGRLNIVMCICAVLLQCDCPYVGCGESYSDHSTIHAQVTHLSLYLSFPCSFFPYPLISIHVLFLIPVSGWNNNSV